LLKRAIREAAIRQEVEPFVGFASSLLIGSLALPFAIWLSGRLCLIWTPAFRRCCADRVSRHSDRASADCQPAQGGHQVLGYLALENGIFVFGVGLARQATFLVEMGILLDVFVAVFVMGIAIFHISGSSTTSTPISCPS
jgi:hydrogenase-4 component E